MECPETKRATEVPTLPTIPEPTEVEIELTNACNARCLVCPRNALPPLNGLMSERVFMKILDNYATARETFQINRILGSTRYPVLTLAGLGEPTLHPDLSRFARAAVEAGFEVALFTNGFRLAPGLAADLVTAGVQRIYVSFWGIDPEEYTAAMGLSYETTLTNVEHLARLCEGTGTRLVICWIRTPVIRSSPEQVQAFWGERGIEVDMSEFEPWNRGGLVEDPRLTPAFSNYPSIDENKPVWCSQLYFTDTLTWEGFYVICSQDYFQRRYVMGNVLESVSGKIGCAKAALLASRPLPVLCQRCRKPDRNYRFGSEPWDRILGEDHRRKYYYV